MKYLILAILILLGIAGIAGIIYAADIYDWVGGIPIQTHQETEWVGGVPYVFVTTTAAAEVEVVDKPDTYDFWLKSGTNQIKSGTIQIK